jgi:hypothetical protein
MAMNSGQDCIDMAETLIVLAGPNAWLAAREFGSQAAHQGDAVGAKHWRGVARAILRKETARLSVPLEQLSLSLMPVAEPVVAEPVLIEPLRDDPALAPARTDAEVIAAPAIVEAVAVEMEAAPAESASAAVAEEAPAIETADIEVVVLEPISSARELGANAPIPLRARRQAMVEALDEAAAEAIVREAA